MLTVSCAFILSGCNDKLYGKYVAENNTQWYFEFDGDIVTYHHPSGMSYRAKYKMNARIMEVYEFDQTYGQGFLYNRFQYTCYILDDQLIIDNVVYTKIS